MCKNKKGLSKKLLIRPEKLNILNLSKIRIRIKQSQKYF